jgi:hypothetical protein
MPKSENSKENTKEETTQKETTQKETTQKETTQKETIQNETNEETTQNETNEEITQKETKKEIIITSTPKNRGKGAGGSNTNKFGKKFEEKTNNVSRLLDSGYTKTCFKKSKTYYLSKEYEDRTVIFVSQNALKLYIFSKYQIELFRCPDEAYIVEYKSGAKIISILEKKEQSVEGSVETKLWSGVALKREYELMLGSQFKVYYGFCVNNFLQNKLTSSVKKYVILNSIFAENNIEVLFGDNADYFDALDKWITGYY